MLLRRLEPPAQVYSTGCMAQHPAQPPQPAVSTSCPRRNEMSCTSPSGLLQEAKQWERLLCACSLALSVAPTLNVSIKDPPQATSAWGGFFISESHVIACGSSPQLVRAGGDTIDLDGVIDVCSRTWASSVLCNILLIYIMCLISVSSCGSQWYAYISLDNCYQS